MSFKRALQSAFLDAGLTLEKEALNAFVGFVEERGGEQELIYALLDAAVAGVHSSSQWLLRPSDAWQLSMPHTNLCLPHAQTPRHDMAAREARAQDEVRHGCMQSARRPRKSRSSRRRR